MKRMAVVLLWLGLAGGLLAACATPAKQVAEEREALAHRRLGEAYLRDGNFQAARVELQKSIRLNPEDKEAHYLLGLVYDRGLGQLQAALEAYQEALRLDPEYSEAHNALGGLYGKMGRWEDAIQAFQRALKNPLYREPAPAHFNLGLAYYHLKRYDEAMAAFADAIRVDPAYLDPRMWRGITLYEQGKDREAIDELGRVLRLNPRYPDAYRVYYYLGLAYLRLGQKADAEKAFRQTVELAPRSDLARSAQRYLSQLRAP